MYTFMTDVTVHGDITSNELNSFPFGVTLLVGTTTKRAC
ncbi:hypothetical protein SEPL_177 [Salmonella phage SE_PL]|nr:hypothetical protein 7t3_0419 [Salmonella phage 7t3]QIG62790.1 hypothetical protein SEPL_177 [Salmonella phage SE_PL]